ncbi:MAG: ribonuclease E activity regulator RraA [Chromatiales bacterium]|jgi:regulator of ribonuclease activity A|nr:ribonuclease E activity regulator RraA [Chromatiales bacterium]
MEVLTADICDAHPGDIEVAEPIMRHFGGRKRFHGETVTMKVHEDNVLVRKAVESPGDGRVLIVDGGGSLRRALLGDRLAALATENGWSGVVVNGCIRDSAEIARIDLGVIALATHPRKSKKNGDGYTGTSVSFAGVTIRPGQYLYADEDGWVIAARALHGDA